MWILTSTQEKDGENQKAFAARARAHAQLVSCVVKIDFYFTLIYRSILRSLLYATATLLLS